MMSIRLCRAILVGLIVAGTPFISTHAAMSTPGQFSVSGSGATTYMIPIQAAPGTGGIEPKMSLSYTSQGGNGLLGVGGSLNGLSAIGHCPQTKAQDGTVNGAVNYDTNDRFCLDSQRLIAINGVYGANGTEYRTELQNFSKIVSYGASGNGPTSFKVWTKSGQIMTYGGTSSGRLEAQGKSTVRVWALDKLQDTVGNYLTVTYNKDAVNGDYYPQRIDYTGNANTGLAPNNSLQFQYETRPDITPLYQAGSLIKSSVRLSKIQVFQNTALLREYRVSYALSPATKYSRLISVTECAGDMTCLAPIQLTWSDKVNAFLNGGTAITGAYAAWANSPDRIRVMDVNGDGLPDIVLGPDASGKWYVLRSTGTSFVDDGAWITGAYANWAGESNRIRVMDVNGDGLADIVIGPDANGSWYVLRSTGTSFVNDGAWITGAYGAWQGSADRIRVVDINGDGRQDILLGPDAAGNWYVLRSTGTSFVNDGAWVTNAYANWAAESGRVRIMDVNGDGLSDVVVGPDSSGNWYVLRSTGTSFINDGAWITGAYGAWGGSADRMPVMDVNGDGLPDIVLGPDANGKWYVLRSTGTSFVDDGAWISGAYANWAGESSRVRVMDVNGDGLADIVIGPDVNGSWYVLRSTGTSFVNDGAWITGAYGSWDLLASRIRSMDINGDGLQDIVLGPDINGSWYHLDNNKPAEKVTSISDGLGANISITYKPLTDKTIYTKDTGSNAAAYPMVDLQIPLHVVSTVNTSNGVGGQLTTNYTYGGLKVDSTGRGTLGFRWIQSTQVESNLTNRTEYRQDWPYVGLPSLVKKTTSSGGNGGLLNQVSNAFGCIDFVNTSGCTVAAGKRYFPFVSQSVESNWDLSGTALPSVTTTTQYDTWGNATQVNVTTSDGYSKTNTNTYSNDVTNWFLGRLTGATVTSTMP